MTNKTRPYFKTCDGCSSFDLTNKRLCSVKNCKDYSKWKNKTKENKKGLDKVAQYMVFVFGVVAAFLVSLSTDGDLQKWGYLFGVIGCPAWLYTTWVNKQYPLFGLSIFYTFTWTNGLFNNVALSDIADLFTRLIHLIA